MLSVGVCVCVQDMTRGEMHKIQVVKAVQSNPINIKLSHRSIDVVDRRAARGTSLTSYHTVTPSKACLPSQN